VQKKHGPTAIDVAYDRKTRKAEDKELDLLAGHLDSEQPTRVYSLHVRTGWHHSKVERLLARLKVMKRARQEKGGWLAVEATANPPKEKSAEQNSSAAPENSKHVQVKVGRFGWVPAPVEWGNGNGVTTGRVLIACDKCHDKSAVYLSHDRAATICHNCDATMRVSKV
jgi:hypothetical protein